MLARFECVLMTGCPKLEGTRAHPDDSKESKRGLQGNKEGIKTRKELDKDGDEEGVS